MKAKYRDRVDVHDEGDGYSPLKADDAQSVANVVTPLTPIRREFKSKTINFQTTQIRQGNVGASPLRYPIMNLKEIVLRLW